MPERMAPSSAAEETKTDDDLPPPPPSRGKNREVWVGLFVILGIAATLAALFTLTDAAFFRGRYIISTRVDDAGGIRRGDPVQMRGVNIGRVQRFRISQQGVEVRLEIEGEYDIPADSRVVITSSGLLQGMVAEIVPGQSDRHIGQGDSLPGATEKGMLASTEGLADQADATLKRVQELLSKRTIENVETSAAELRGLLKELSGLADEQRKELRQLSQSLRKSSAGLERVTSGAERATGSIERATAGPELERSVKRVDSLTQRLDEASASFDRSSRSLETVLSRIERGEGTLGKLTKDDALYVNLNQAALNLSRLAEDVRRQPKRYVNLSIF